MTRLGEKYKKFWPLRTSYRGLLEAHAHPEEWRNLHLSLSSLQWKPSFAARRTLGSNYGLVGAGCSLKASAVKHESLANNELRNDTCSANKPTLCTNKLSFLSADP
eukprot:TRINITY_DN2297_c1_g1_i12.p1 TRINITY_DN2297_c1_g1~~TRINITY_DN2297_c1_g1_i12.p1  ORF type:complete len:106 (+),score=3.04 TRINITY_DN2297_c1_g1_i12:227-544(+)